MSTQEWREENKTRNYPFSLLASRTNGLDVIPVGLFLDAVLYPTSNLSNLFLSSVVISDVITLNISDGSGVVGIGSYSRMSSTDRVGVYDTGGSPVGVLVVDPNSLSLLAGWSAGVHPFTEAQTSFALSTIKTRPISGVRGITTPDGTLWVGDIHMLGSDGIVLQFDGGKLRIDIVGDPDFIKTICTAEGIVKPEVTGIKSINGIGPVNGMFMISVGSQLAEDTLLRVSPGSRGLRFDVVGQKGQ